MPLARSSFAIAAPTFLAASSLVASVTSARTSRERVEACATVLPGDVVDDLGVDVLRAAEDAEARLSRTSR